MGPYFWTTAILSTLALGGLLVLGLQYRRLRHKLSKERERRSNYETITEQANDIILVVDITDGKILKTNRMAVELLGYSRGHLKQMNLLELHLEEQREESAEIIADTWENDGLVYEKLPFVKADGERMPVECSAKVMTYAGHPAITIYARDITERLKMERQILEQKETIEAKNQQITDSINYARNIQEALLPDPTELKEGFPDSFILYKPCDIVSGDFFWFSSVKKEGLTYDVITAADCTGHGVPGAFMSMIGHTLLNQIVDQQKEVRPANILKELRTQIIRTLSDEKGGGLKDGMDIALCCFQREERRLSYAGAQNPLYLVREDGSFEQYKGDPFPIGSFFGEGKEKEFSEQVTELLEGDTFYLFTDGFPDQFGSDSDQAPERATGYGKKYSKKRFKRMLSSLQQKPMQEQGALMEKEFESWKGELDQVDDVLVVGCRYGEE